MSTRFFSRYSVKTSEIEQGQRKSGSRDFDVQRVADERDFERDIIDCRIMFEMIGERFTLDDYPDETSES